MQRCITLYWNSLDILQITFVYANNFFLFHDKFFVQFSFIFSQDVIRRHFAVKKDAIIEQVQNWLRQVQSDNLNNSKDKNDKKNNVSSDMTGGLGVVSVKSMEKTVELLFTELAQLGENSYE